MKKFDISDPSGCKQYYDENGYVVFKNLISDDLCDSFIKVYEKLKGDRLFIYPSQSTYDVFPFVPNSDGYIAESVENPAFLVLRPKFAQAARDCLLDEGMAKGLAALDGHTRHVFWQSMFFDKSTGTTVHQDSIYLDTDPRGHLIGAWLALEDINPESGPFIVYPGTHKSRPYLDEDADTYGNIHKYCLNIIDKSNYQLVEMTVDKGDVIFWHPFLIHGAADNLNPKFSRKSLTGHYYPSEFATILDGKKKAPTHSVSPAFDLHTRSHAYYHMGAYFRWMKRKLARRPALSSKEMKVKALQG